MYVLKAFATNSRFIDNDTDVVHPIGELSPTCMTFSRDIGYYRVASTPAQTEGATVLTFMSKNDGVREPLSLVRRDHVLGIVGWIYNNTLNTSGQIFADEFLEDMITEFAADIENIQCGEIVTDGQYWIPEWVSWKRKNDGDNYFRIWFAEESFRTKYDEYEITIVPPLKPLNDFFKVGLEVENQLKARTVPQLIEQIQAARDNHPETILTTMQFKYHDPNTETRRIETDWTMLIYGPAGNNVDSIKDALVEYILANSTHLRPEWAEILPDIFKRTEFVLLPLMNQYAIPNRTLVAGLYSPIVNLASAESTIQPFASEYPLAHIKTHLTAMGHPYKSVAILSVSSPENRDGLYKLTDVFPDLIMVSSTSQDFNRMTEATRKWAEYLAEMLIVAESMSQYSDIPAGMTRLIRNGKLYLVKNYDNIHYLVAAKSNFPEV